MTIRAKAARKPRPGRPTIRTPEIAAAICERIASGQSLYRIVTRPGMPSYAAVCVWLREDREFQEQYARARVDQADFLADEIVTLADSAQQATACGPNGELAVDPARVQAIKLAVEARKWVASKLHRTKYGDSATAATTTVNFGMQVNVLTEEARARLIEKKRAAIARQLAEHGAARATG